MKIVDESILFFSLKILFRGSYSFVGIRDIYTRVRMKCETSGFLKQGWLAAWSRGLTESRDNRTASCPILSCSAPTSMMLQLLACLACVQLLAACSRESPVSLCFSYTLLTISSQYLTHYPYKNLT